MNVNPVNLNLGCGMEKIKGFINVDHNGTPDVIHNLDVYPYPFESNSIDYILASHVLEHLKEPMDFFTEINRILKVGGIIKIKCPHSSSAGAFCDMTHRRYFNEYAIRSITGEGLTKFKDDHAFKHIKTKVKRGRFMKWQKREIIWIIQKV